MKIAVVGAAGRMGSAVCQAVDDAEDLELCARLDADDSVFEGARGADVVVDFTVPSVTRSVVAEALRAGAHVVVGTTGWDEAGYDEVAELARQAGRNVVIAPNFSISAVLMMHLAASAAPYFESTEIIEMHHPDKVDAPSGTAHATARAIAAAREGRPMPDATQTDPDGSRGARVEGVPVHAVRLRGLTAHQEVLLGNAGETLTIRADSFDRSSFMPGVLHAVRRVGELEGLTVGLEVVLGLTR
ncbi:MAG: 4-hydroxy-tetrahydrodipicolinate reductase [Bowdeniella nasicola]|nr:4-hydroxy-tetrahydrodipicolinate reductase [Bowdeniella nasicola]